jgi:hypothetical protein
MSPRETIEQTLLTLLAAAGHPASPSPDATLRLRSGTLDLAVTLGPAAITVDLAGWRHDFPLATDDDDDETDDADSAPSPSTSSAPPCSATCASSSIATTIARVASPWSSPTAPTGDP